MSNDICPINDIYRIVNERIDKEKELLVKTNQFFLTFNTAAVGAVFFAIFTLYQNSEKFPYLPLVMIYLVNIFGFTLATFWWVAVERALAWRDFWIAKAIDFEKQLDISIWTEEKNIRVDLDNFVNFDTNRRVYYFFNPEKNTKNLFGDHNKKTQLLMRAFDNMETFPITAISFMGVWFCLSLLNVAMLTAVNAAWAWSILMLFAPLAFTVIYDALVDYRKDVYLKIGFVIFGIMALTLIFYLCAKNYYLDWKNSKINDEKPRLTFFVRAPACFKKNEVSSRFDIGKNLNISIKSIIQ